MLIENKDAAGKVDFDDKTSWEYLFKVYWVYLKGNLSLTLDELTQAKNPWKISDTIASIEPTGYISASGRRSITAELSLGNMEANESKRRKTDEQTNGLPKESPSIDGPKEWASKELLDFVAHMKNGDTSVLSQFDVQALLLEYIKRNNLRDPRKKTQIERRSNRKAEKRITHNKLDEYAAIDVHNMSLIYMRRNVMESLIEDREKFHEKVVGSIVQIRISGSDQKDDMYRLVQVVGTTKVDLPYKIGDKSVDIMLEVSNLEKKETVSIDTISNQELSEDECRRMRESVRCGLVRCFTVGEIQEKAIALQSVLIDDKLKRLKTPEERERQLREIPEVHSDPKMNPDYESDDTEEYFNNEDGEHPKPEFPWVSDTNTTTPKKAAESLTSDNQPRDSSGTTYPNLEEDTSKPNTGKDPVGLSGSRTPQIEADYDGPTVSKSNPEAAVSSSLPKDDTVDMWHYRDPSGNVQGPFSVIQLRLWSTSGYFPPDMRVWATREADSLLLNKVLQEQIHNYNNLLPKNVAPNNKVQNQIERVVAPNNKVQNQIERVNVSSAIQTSPTSVNLEILPNNLNCDPPSAAMLTKMNESMERINTRNVPDINQHVPSVSVVADSAPVDIHLPSSVLKRDIHENKKVQDSIEKEETKLVVQDSVNPPTWSTSLSLEVGGAQLPETANDWAVKPVEWDTSHVPVSSLNHQVVTSNPHMDQITDLPSWHGLGETIEFSTLAEESVSDLLAEVDAMESQNCVPSPTSRRNSFLEDLFNGSIDDFSPTGDQGTRSDGFSSSADIQLSRQSTGLPFSFGLETKPNSDASIPHTTNLAVSIPQTTNSDNMGFKWAEMGGAMLHPPRQNMIDLNDYTRAEADEAERDDQIEEKATSRMVGGSNSKEKEGESVNGQVSETKLVGGFQEAEEEEGKPSHGTTSAGRVHTHSNSSRSGSVARDSHHRRSSGGGDRYSSNSPRERGHHVEESGYNRSSRSSWSRQSSFGAGSGGGSGSGYSRPPSKVQRVCKFYESGRCKKGSTCAYLHPKDRFLDINSSAWSGLEETAGGSCPSQHIGAFLRLLAEDSGDVSEETSDQELALSNAVDAMVASIEITPEDYISSKEKQRAYADELQEKLATNEAKPEAEAEDIKNELDKDFQNAGIKIENEKVEKMRILFVFLFLDINSSAWSGLEETAGGSCPSQHIGAFLRLLAEDSGDVSEETSDQELALSNAVDAMVASIEITPEDYISSKEKQRAYADELQEKLATNEAKPEAEAEDIKNELDKDFQNAGIKIEHEKVGINEDFENKQEKDCKKDDLKHVDEKDCKIEDLKLEDKKECKNEDLKNEHEKDSKNEDSGNKEKNCKSTDTNEVPIASNSDVEEKVNEEVKMLSYGRKVTVLYQLLSACLADIPEDDSKSKKRAKGYDARHRAALRLLSTWFGIKWIKMEAIEIIVACSAMAILKQEEAKQEEQEPKSKWAKWKRGGIIGAAAITGGTLMAITGGLAAPAIAAGFSALAPTLGTIIPVIGAGGFAAVATAAGSVAGSVAVAASFGAAGAGLTGTKMARRTGSVDEFEFKAIGENHNQGRLAVEILVSGFVFEERDFFRPWEGQTGNMERYVLQWESKHLYAVSTAIQDWLSSTLAMELMRRGAMMTVLSGFLSAFAWPATLLWLTDIIDSKWTIAVNRSDKAGKLLAEVLIKGLQGNRPVTLVGFSLGARAIFKCLQHLAETGNDGLVERVVLLGAPVAIQGENWGAARKFLADS
ncbi:alpha/Beta hydrolase fold protein [Artemisia annua]|uniref:Alpha/Beta hydrolase fold protein n=1 Tax=Artemisia annua TaxID=35608 RepID=A0A2U1LKS6_ARTAN|nr:alpha/Beta hydrolase fold protein [Artemisia annua]